MRRGLGGIAVACSALLATACAGSTEPSATAQPSTPVQPTAPAQPSATPVVLTDLADPAAVSTWTTVNDPVMGGRSTSQVTPGGGGLVFSGTISLDNNGGFASARSPRNADIGRKAAGATAFRVDAVGDGKTYLLKVGDAGQPFSYIQRFTTEAGVARGYDLPITGFEPVGERLDPAPEAPPRLDPSTVNEVALYILDKQQGPFELTVMAISALP